MTFDELLVQVRELLQSKGRVSYRALKLQFNLDDEYLAGLKDELIEAERVAADEGGKVLVWIGNSSPESRVRGARASFPRSDPGPWTPNPRLDRRTTTVNGDVL